MHIRVKVSDELHREIKALAARAGLTQEKWVVGLLEKEVMPIERSGKTNTSTPKDNIAVTGGQPSGERAGAIIIPESERHKQPSEFVQPKIIDKYVIPNERLQRLVEGWNMDSRDCIQCGVMPGMKHRAGCKGWERDRAMAREKMNGEK